MGWNIEVNIILKGDELSRSKQTYLGNLIGCWEWMNILVVNVFFIKKLNWNCKISKIENGF
jgi:hypothetical protein